MPESAIQIGICDWEGDIMIQPIHKGVEIEMEVHQFPHGCWKCDYTLITHPGGIRMTHPGDMEFPNEDLATEHALQDARDAIDRAKSKAA